MNGNSDPSHGATGLAPPGAGTRDVLVVEDDVDSAESLAMLLQMWGYYTRVVHDGEEALAEAARRLPDVALIDLRLPRASGYEVARRLRELARPRFPLLIALTACVSEQERKDSYDVGFHLHLNKPFDPTSLRCILERFSRVLSATADDLPANCDR